MSNWALRRLKNSSWSSLSKVIPRAKSVSSWEIVTAFLKWDSWLDRRFKESSERKDLLPRSQRISITLLRKLSILESILRKTRMIRMPNTDLPLRSLEFIELPDTIEELEKSQLTSDTTIKLLVLWLLRLNVNINILIFLWFSCNCLLGWCWSWCCSHSFLMTTLKAILDTHLYS